MTTLYVDLETASTIDLKKYGVYRYCADVRILLTCWAVDQGPIVVDEQPSAAFWSAFDSASEIVAHNAEFDRTVIETLFPETRPARERWHCTMAQARAHGLPGGLGHLCDVFKVTEDKAKVKDARRLLMLFCKPRKDGTWATQDTRPAEWAEFRAYGGRDVASMRELHRIMPAWNRMRERPIYHADQRINARGFAVDVQFAREALRALDQCAADTDAQVALATGGAVSTARKRDAILGYILAEHGVDLPDLTDSTVQRRLDDSSLPDAVRELLALRQQSSRTSTGKYRTLLGCVDTDGRMRGTITYAGASRTGRWAGNRFQPHNLPRPRVGTLRDEAITDTIAACIEAIRQGVYDLVAPYPLPEVAASAVRGCVVARPGYRLTIGDYANVEGRALAWLAGEHAKLRAFEAYDAGTGPDLYKVAYAAAFGISPAKVTGTQRQIGKVLELMYGYGGGVGAGVTGAITYGIDLDELADRVWPSMSHLIEAQTAAFWEWAHRERRTFGLSERTFRALDAMKRLWRQNNPAIVQLWAAVDAAARAAILQGGVHPVGERIVIDRRRAWLRIHLPSGRYLSYPSPRVSDTGAISFKGVSPYTHQWSRVTTYGGKLVENITQAFCRDILAEGLVNAENEDLGIVLHAHDELVEETPAKIPAPEAEARLRRVMTGIPFARGLPLAVATYTATRYHKE